MGRLTLMFFLASALCAVLGQEDAVTTTEASSPSPAAAVTPTRLPSASSSTEPNLVHNVNETVNNATTEAEKKIGKNSSGTSVMNAGLLLFTVSYVVLRV